MLPREMSDATSGRLSMRLKVRLRKIKGNDMPGRKEYAVRNNNIDEVVLEFRESYVRLRFSGGHLTRTGNQFLPQAQRQPTFPWRILEETKVQKSD